MGGVKLFITYLFIFSFLFTCKAKRNNLPSNLEHNNFSDTIYNELLWRINCINLKTIKECDKNYSGFSGTNLFIFPTLFNSTISKFVLNQDTILVQVIESIALTSHNLSFDTSNIYWLGFNQKSLDLYWKIHDSLENKFYRKVKYSKEFSTTYYILNKKDVRIMLKRPELFNVWMQEEIIRRRLDTLFPDLKLNKDDYLDPNYRINIPFKVF